MTHTIDRRQAMQISALATLPALLASPASAANAASPKAKDPVHDFDFLIGSWHVAHRRLKQRLLDSQTWEEFDGTCTMGPLLDGSGNVDDNVINLPSGTYRGVGLRSFDPKTRQWAIWWLDSRNPHMLDVPVVGGFENGVGAFLADDTLRGKPIKVRFRWSDIKRNSCTWEQAFSPDAGANWEVNWIMHFKRTAG
jgi:hypothetical protein